MTKVVTGLATLILEDEGKLSVNDPVSKYIPEFSELRFKDGSQPQRPITLIDVMTHTAGMKNKRGDVKNLKEAVDLILEQPLLSQPGEVWKYGPGLTICGRVIEIVSGLSYENFLEERLFKPLNMADTTFQARADTLARSAYVYQPGPQKGSIMESDENIQGLPTLEEHRFANPSAGLISTALDMASFYQMLLKGGTHLGKRIVSKDMVDKLTKIHVWDFEKIGFVPGSGWGLGCGIVREPKAHEVTAMLSPGTYGHGGARGTQSWADPKRNMIFILMIQRTKFGNGDQSVVRRVFQDLAVKNYAD